MNQSDQRIRESENQGAREPESQRSRHPTGTRPNKQLVCPSPPAGHARCGKGRSAKPKTKKAKPAPKRASEAASTSASVGTHQPEPVHRQVLVLDWGGCSARAQIQLEGPGHSRVRASSRNIRTPNELSCRAPVCGEGSGKGLLGGGVEGGEAGQPAHACSCGSTWALSRPSHGPRARGVGVHARLPGAAMQIPTPQIGLAAPVLEKRDTLDDRNMRWESVKAGIDASKQSRGHGPVFVPAGRWWAAIPGRIDCKASS